MSEPDDKAEWLRPQEVAARFGLQVETVYQLVYLEKIPPCYVRKLPHYAHAIAINWTAIQHVPRKECCYSDGRKFFRSDWRALETTNN